MAQFTFGTEYFRSTLFDAGCGNGELMRLLATRFQNELLFKMAGCEIEPGHAEVARNRSGKRVLVAHAKDVTTEMLGFRADYIAAIGWLHNDWPSLFATGIPASEADPFYLHKIFWSFSRLLPLRGLLIFDKIPADTPELAQHSFRVIESKTAPCGDTFHIAEKVAQPAPVR